MLELDVTHLTVDVAQTEPTYNLYLYLFLLHYRLYRTIPNPDKVRAIRDDIKDFRLRYVQILLQLLILLSVV